MYIYLCVCILYMFDVHQLPVCAVSLLTFFNIANAYSILILNDPSKEKASIVKSTLPNRNKISEKQMFQGVQKVRNRYCEVFCSSNLFRSLVSLCVSKPSVIFAGKDKSLLIPYHYQLLQWQWPRQQAQCYKTDYSRNVIMFIISQSVCL